MGEVILYGSEKADDEKYDWNAAFNNAEFISYITDIPELIDYIGYETYIPDNEYVSRIDFKTATFPNCSGYIGSHAFDSCKNMKFISFLNSYSNPSDIKYIGEHAFNNCKNLSSVYIQVARNISEYAFAMLYNLQSFTMNSIYYSDADLVKINIGSHAFEMCTNSNLSISINTVKNIDAYAFANCINAKYLNAGNYMCNKVSYRAFDNCSSLLSIYLNTYGYYSSNASNNKLIIDDEAFTGCISLSLVSTCNLKSIGKRAFKNLSNLSYFTNYINYTESSKSTIIDYLTYIDEEAFDNCTSLNMAYACSYIDTICENAFRNCKSLTSNPGSYICKKVSKNAFNNCLSLKSIILNQYGYRLLSNTGISVICKIDKSAFSELNNLEYISVTNLECIEPYMFANRSKLYNVQINTIDLYYLSSYIYLPDIKINIGSHAFESCNNLQNIYLNIVNNIDDYAFADCFNLSYAYIGSSLCNRIGKSAFKNCTNISYAMFNYIYSSYPSIDNQLYIDNNAFENCESLEYLSLYGVKYIGDSILKGCTNLIGLYISSPIIGMDMPYDMLSDCSRLSYVTLNFLCSVTSSIFSYCKDNLNRLSIPYCSYIGSKAFYRFTNLKSVSNIGLNLSTGVSIDEYAFAECYLLGSLVIGLNNVGSHAFENCINLSLINGPIYNNVDIGDYAFAGCPSLSMITIGARDIGSHAFENCSNLTLLTGPPCCRSVGAYAFAGCSSTAFTSHFYNGSSTLEYIGSHAFENLQTLKYIELNYVSSVTNLESIDAFNGIASDYVVPVPVSLYFDFINHSVWSLISEHIVSVNN